MTALSPPRQICRFGPIEVEYDRRVLEPRGWTLLQSRWAAELAEGAAGGPILELCAGAGHIGLAAAVLSGRGLVQIELDPVAAGFARANADRADLAERVEIRNARLQTALAEGELFPLIVADPPYLPTAEVDSWPDDPRTAIDGGPAGLDLVQACLDAAREHLAPGGSMLLQVAGAGQAQAVADGLRAGDGTLTAGEVRAVDDRRAVVRVTRG